MDENTVYISCTQVAAILNVSPATARAWCAKGYFECFQVNSRWKIKYASFIQWVKAARQETLSRPA